MKHDVTEGVRVGIIGAIGFVGSLTLSEVSVIVSICVGLATLVYVLAKTYFLFKHNGRGREE